MKSNAPFGTELVIYRGKRSNGQAGDVPKLVVKADHAGWLKVNSCDDTSSVDLPHMTDIHSEHMAHEWFGLHRAEFMARPRFVKFNIGNAFSCLRIVTCAFTGVSEPCHRLDRWHPIPFKISWPTLLSARHYDLIDISWPRSVGE